MKIAYFDCFSGISGDMVLGALVNAGVDPNALNTELAKLKLDEFTLRFEETTKHSISGTRAVVETADSTGDSHDHNDSPAAHHHHTHNHAHDHDHEHHDHPHTHGPSRHLSDIFAVLDNSDLDEVIIDRAKQIFDRLAAAEAKVHNTSKDQVHLHEVSGIDAIVDIVGAVVGLHLLEVDEIHASPLITRRRFRSMRPRAHACPCTGNNGTAVRRTRPADRNPKRASDTHRRSHYHDTRGWIRHNARNDHQPNRLRCRHTQP